MDRRDAADDAYSVEMSPLQRVLAVGRRESRGGLGIELFAIELRGRGALLSWRIDIPESDPLHSDPRWPDLRITEDVSTV